MRAKPLNHLTRAALREGLQTWDDEIDYLKAALPMWTTGSNVHTMLATKLANLVRSREWLASKIEEIDDESLKT